jgi:MinD-like ATPase involved in chromosome partitioning or flagellar assembly
MTVCFDDSLPILARIVIDEMGEEVLASGTVLRDVMGRLAFFVDKDLEESAVARLSQQFQEKLGVYARTDRVIAGRNDFGTAKILADPMAVWISVDQRRVRLVDRRLVGADWLRSPVPVAPPPPRYVFASLKGGVGRSTALAVAAADLAAKGCRVLVIDLDMEAPGLGAMLLNDGTLPRFGTIDAMLESGLAPLDETFFADLIGPSSLADQGGKIDVIPAFGRQSTNNPGDILAKIARAYAEGMGPDGQVSTILDRVGNLVDHFADSARYDAILVDSRAGLHETTASAVLGLGAEVFLFGLDEPQTFQGYLALLAHLARFADRAGPAPEWLARMTMVHGKAPVDADDRAEFAQRCRKLFIDAGLGPSASSVDEVPLPGGRFSDVPWNDDPGDQEVLPDEDWQPRDPVAIVEDDAFRRFNPLIRRDLLSERVYKAAFGDFLERMTETLFAGGGQDE